MSVSYLNQLIPTGGTSIKINGNVSQDAKNWYAVHYKYSYPNSDLYSSGPGQGYGGDSPIIGSVTKNGITTPCWTSIYDSNQFSSLMVRLTSDRTFLQFPVMGIYTITFRTQPTYSGTNAPGPAGQVNAPFFAKVQYLGQLYNPNDYGLNNRLVSEDTISGPYTANYIAQAHIISYTGLFYAGDAVSLWVFNTVRDNIAVSITPTSGTTFTSTLLQPLYSDATLYKSITLNTPTNNVNFEQLRYFSGNVEITPLAVANPTNGINNYNGTFNSDNMYGAYTTFTATFNVPQAITQVWYRPHPYYICNSWGNTLTIKDTNDISYTSLPMQPPVCPIGYDTSGANPAQNTAYLIKYNLGTDQALPYWTYGFSTDDLPGNKTFLIVGDSTSYSQNMWVYQLATWMAAKYTEHNILYYLWDDVAQQYSSPIQFGDALAFQTINIYNASTQGGFANGLMGSKYGLAIDKITPDFVWLNHGKSYATGTLNSAVIEGDIYSAVAQLQLAFPTTPMILTIQPPNRDDANYDVVKTALLDIIGNLYFSGSSITTIDVYTLFTNAGKPAAWYSDNYLPSALGVTQWVNLITSQWQYMLALPAGSTTPFLNKVVPSPAQFLFDSSQSSTRYGDFNVSSGANTVPAGWTSSGNISFFPSTLLASYSLTNALHMTGSGSSPTFITRTITSSALNNLKNIQNNQQRFVMLTWLSNIQVGAASTVGRVSLNYTSASSGGINTIMSRARTDIQGGFVWQHIGPVYLPSDISALSVNLYHDTSSTPDTTHYVVYQQVLMTQQNYPTTLYATPISTIPYCYPNWQVAFNVPNGQDVGGLGAPDNRSTSDAIKLAISNRWDSFMTILTTNPIVNYYSGTAYQYYIQGTNANDGTNAETFRSRAAFGGYLNWVIIYFGIRDASVLFGNTGYKWIDSSQQFISGTIAVNLTPAQAVAAVHALNTYEVCYMNYNKVTGAYELIRPSAYYIPDNNIANLGNYDSVDYSNISAVDSQGNFWPQGYQFANEGHFRRTMRKIQGCIGAVTYNRSGVLETYFKQTGGSYGYWRDKGPNGDNDPPYSYWAADIFPSSGNNIIVLASNGTTSTVAGITSRAEAAAKAAGTITTIKQNFLYPDVRIIDPPRYWNFYVKAYNASYAFSQPTAVNAPINYSTKWLVTFYNANIRSGLNLDPKGYQYTQLPAQQIPGCTGVVNYANCNFYAKDPIRTMYDLGSDDSCMYYAPYTVQGTPFQYVGYVGANLDGTATILISPPGTWSSSLPLKYKAVGASNSTLQDATFNVLDNFPNDGSDNFTLSKYPADQQNFRRIYYFIATNCPNYGVAPVAFRYDSSVGFNYSTRTFGSIFGQITYLTTL